ncbi:ferrous iron transport protein B [Anaerococcus sp. AGMB00486]|uniref:Ferrous iron transport protein B n=2 Tax=Anaerococcus TaxID=165779 RepID=A0ABX2N8Z2_9FIRM|nr:MULTISPECIES: ferrous iron transport protein B [Anaerococcus]MDY3007263.1 ferrous iron transport protein B [Anaerococcus porci]MSS77482.1 ferrous iron transport protein B [Anaerococcus porci]NVF11149.1 ferrous iron transport protein B [Anaerococcus faecalis]
MTYTVALAGNPNSGKTTLFNELTGSNQRVGNWPGVTVDKKEGRLKGHKDIIIQDLPGIYSLSPYTMEEVVSRQYLVENRPDLIVNLVDGSNLVRNLYLTSQLIELGIPTILALNMMDIVKNNGDIIDTKKLSELLGCPVVEIIASKKKGTDALVKEIVKSNGKKYFPHPLTFSKELEKALSEIENEIKDSTDKNLLRYYSIKAFENDDDMLESIKLSQSQKDKINKLREDFEQKEEDVAEGIITTERYDALGDISERVLKKAPPKLSTTDKIDKIVTNRILGLPIFALVMFVIYYIAISTLGTGATDAANGFFEDTLTPATADFLTNLGINDVLVGLATDGIIAGVGAVLGFLPQMLVLFALLSILEDIGYMARVAFVMDRVFRKFGLSGKSFIPVMIGTGCSVPGIQSSRTIENQRDRRITIMTTSFMPCSAKLPVIALIAGAFFEQEQALVTFSFYIIGIFAVIISGVILKKFREFASEPAPFVMELPPYHAPRITSVLRDVFNKGMAFVKRAGTIILVSSIIIWFLSSFDFSFNMVEAESENSILAVIGGYVAVLLKPLGFGQWQSAVATITGFVAKENVVSTMGVVLGIGSDLDETNRQLITAFNAAIGTPIAGYSFLLFNMLCMPCFAAVGAIKTEMNNNRWTLIAIGYQMIFAYSIAFIFYNLANFFLYGIFSIKTILAVIVLIGILYLIFRPVKYKEKKKKYKVRLAQQGR